jgi:hypothetical protein
MQRAIQQTVTARQITKDQREIATRSSAEEYIALITCARTRDMIQSPGQVREGVYCSPPSNRADQRPAADSARVDGRGLLDRCVLSEGSSCWADAAASDRSGAGRVTVVLLVPAAWITYGLGGSMSAPLTMQTSASLVASLRAGWA